MKNKTRLAIRIVWDIICVMALGYMVVTTYR